MKEYPPYIYEEEDIGKMIDLLETREFFFDIEFKNRANLGVSHYCEELIELLKDNSSISTIICISPPKFEFNSVFFNTDIPEDFQNLKEVAIFYYNEFLRVSVKQLGV